MGWHNPVLDAAEPEGHDVKDSGILNHMECADTASKPRPPFTPDTPRNLQLDERYE